MPQTKTVHLPSGRIAQLPTSATAVTEDVLSKPKRRKRSPISLPLPDATGMQFVHDQRRPTEIRKLLGKDGKLPVGFQWGELDWKGDLIVQDQSAHDA